MAYLKLDYNDIIEKTIGLNKEVLQDFKLLDEMEYDEDEEDDMGMFVTPTILFYMRQMVYLN